MKRKPNPAAAVVSGVGFIAFAIFHYVVGIFPYKSGFEWHVATAADDGAWFTVLVVGSVVLGAACVAWGLLALTRR